MKIPPFNKYIFLPLFFVLGCSFRVHAQVITTIANVYREQGFGGDGAAAVFAKLAGPQSLAVDAAGNIYIADAFNNRIRQIDLFGNMTTFAGTGKAGFSGDGGLAIKAELNTPSYITVDTSGNVYFSDTKNNRVRKINAAGVIETIAGNGISGFDQDSVLATAAKLDAPLGLALDGFGNLFIADNIQIRKIAPNGKLYRVAGTTTGGYGGDGGHALNASFGKPVGLTVDRKGNLYVADRTYHEIRKITPAGIISTCAGMPIININSPVTGDGGPATSAKIVYPTDVKTDTAGNLYITDSYTGRIRKVDTAGIITNYAGDTKGGHTGDGGFAGDAGLDAPYGLAIDNDNNLYLTEFSSAEFTNSVRFIFANTITKSNSAVNLYPNPTFNGVFKVLFSSNYEEMLTLRIVNEAGKQVYINTVPTNREVEVRLQPTGSYYLSGVSVHSKWKDQVSVVH